MKAESRRVYLFIAVGLLAAAVIGYTVWSAGTPTTPSASDTATVTPEVATASEPTTRALLTSRPTEPTDTVDAAEQATAAPLVDDPFLAPHAIVQPVPSIIAPTTVYRPENVSPFGQVPREDDTAAPTTEPTEPTELLTSTSPTAPATPAGTPTATAEPTEPGQPAETVSPAATSPATPPTTPTATAEPTPSAEPTVGPATEPTAPAAPADAPAEPAPAPEEATIEQATVTQDRPGWWLFGRWFPFSS